MYNFEMSSQLGAVHLNFFGAHNWETKASLFKVLLLLFL